MATTFKTFMNNDQVSSRTLLHESIPITGTIVSGTYADSNIKNYSHEMFQSVYDYPYLSSSANHIFDISCGYSSVSVLSKSEGSPGTGGPTISVQNAKKINIYNQMAQVLVGHDVTGAIQRFDRDGNIVGGGDKLDEVFFINFARLLTKDEIKKGSFSIGMYSASLNTTPKKLKTLYDTNAANDYRVNSPAGEYAILYTASTWTAAMQGSGQGLLYYQAGIAVVTASFFSGSSASSTTGWESFGPRSGQEWAKDVKDTLSGSNITASCDAIRNRLHNLSFNNTTELNSTIYFCRANHNDFNYSANPTYVSGSKIRIKNNMNDSPVSYITTVGLYSADNELLAVAKVSEPLKKDPTNELTLRVRLDY